MELEMDGEVPEEVMVPLTRLGVGLANERGGSFRPNRLMKMVRQIRRDKFGDSPSEKLIKDFCTRTSAHGFHKVFQSGSAWHKAAWLCIIVTAFVGFSTHLVSLFSRYIEGPVNTETSVSSTPFVFPDVTICATNHFSRLRFKTNPMVPSLDNMTMSDLVASIKRVWDPTNQLDDGNINADLLNSLKSYLQEVNVTKQRQEMFIHCDFAGNDCNYESFVAYVDPNFFSCFTFSPIERHLLVGGERDGGLRVILYVGDTMNLLTEEESLSYTRGFRTVIHEQGTRPDLLEGFYVQETTSTYVQLGYTEETVLRNCKTEDELQPIRFLDRHGHVREYRYTLRDCLVNTYQTFLHNNCTCVSETLPLPACFGTGGGCGSGGTVFHYCHGIDRDTLLGAGANVTSEDDRADTEAHKGAQSRRHCHDDAVEEIHKRTSGSGHSCPLRCRNTRYEMRVTQNRWPSDAEETREALLRRVNATTELARLRGDDVATLAEIRRSLENQSLEAIKSFARLNIYSHSTRGSRVLETRAYLARNLASDIGGILGLWLGVSIISTFEFVELFVRLLAARRRKESADADGPDA